MDNQVCGVELTKVTVRITSYNVCYTKLLRTFNLQNPEGAVLVFSFVGYEMQEVPVDGRTSIDVVLKSNNIAVDEVVVTALGIKREAKTLTYSSQEVSGDDMMKARDVVITSYSIHYTKLYECRYSVR